MEQDTGVFEGSLEAYYYGASKHKKLFGKNPTFGDLGPNSLIWTYLAQNAKTGTI